MRPSTFYRVKVADLEQWLALSDGKPREAALRQKLRNRFRVRSNESGLNIAQAIARMPNPQGVQLETVLVPPHSAPLLQTVHAVALLSLRT
jgi:hypothetical protein